MPRHFKKSTAWHLLTLSKLNRGGKIGSILQVYRPNFNSLKNKDPLEIHQQIRGPKESLNQEIIYVLEILLWKAYFKMHLIHFGNSILKMLFQNFHKAFFKKFSKHVFWNSWSDKIKWSFWNFEWLKKNLSVHEVKTK